MRVLLVEDEKGVAGFIRKGLEEERYAVDISGDGHEGLSLAAMNQYDLIILDVMLPGLNGIEVCRQIRKQGIKTPVMMLTAKDSVTDKVLGLDSGADDYLTKPFLFEEFLARVRALTRRKTIEIVELSCEELRLDVRSHKVYVGDREIILRPKEFAILECLLRNKGHVLSRTQIMENIWGYNFDAITNIVDVHINAIRERFSEVCDRDYIRTVRGIGYTVDCN
jgi:DNA-binding response OmpR family regulator